MWANSRELVVRSCDCTPKKEKKVENVMPMMGSSAPFLGSQLCTTKAFAFFSFFVCPGDPTRPQCFQESHHLAAGKGRKMHIGVAAFGSGTVPSDNFS